ncbi:hypothetical protein BKG02_004747 [Vibrio parahaemolyticus]|nr:hypothetical protein [Vibrio parahaemolyticus]
MTHTHDEVSQLSIFEMVLSGWKLAFDNPAAAFLVILSFTAVFWFIATFFQKNSIRDLFVNKSDVIKSRKKLGIKEK